MYMHVAHIDRSICGDQRNTPVQLFGMHVSTIDVVVKYSVASVSKRDMLPLALCQKSLPVVTLGNICDQCVRQPVEEMQRCFVL